MTPGCPRSSLLPPPSATVDIGIPDHDASLSLIQCVCSVCVCIVCCRCRKLIMYIYVCLYVGIVCGLVQRSPETKKKQLGLKRLFRHLSSHGGLVEQLSSAGYVAR